MNTDVVYAYLLNLSWFFLSGWILALLLAAVAAFRQD